MKLSTLVPLFTSKNCIRLKPDIEFNLTVSPNQDMSIQSWVKQQRQGEPTNTCYLEILYQLFFITSSYRFGTIFTLTFWEYGKIESINYPNAIYLCNSFFLKILSTCVIQNALKPQRQHVVTKICQAVYLVTKYQNYLHHDCGGCSDWNRIVRITIWCKLIKILIWPMAPRYLITSRNSKYFVTQSTFKAAETFNLWPWLCNSF